MIVDSSKHFCCPNGEKWLGREVKTNDRYCKHICKKRKWSNTRVITSVNLIEC
jgi:hypothetical protein